MGEEEVRSTLGECLKRVIVNRERTLPVIYKPQAMFRSVRHICTGFICRMDVMATN